MKTTIFLLAFILMVRTVTTGATYYSQGSLPPELTTSWNDQRTGGGNSPLNFTSGDLFVIQESHSMTNAAGWGISGTSSELWIENGGILTANFPVTLAKATTFRIDDGGLFIHNNTGIPSSTIFNGIEAFSPNSTFKITGWAGNLYVIPFGVTWGNLVIDVPVLGGSWNQVGNILPVNGTLDIRQTGGNQNEFRLCSRNSMTYIFNIANISVSGGILNIQGGGSSGTPSMTTFVNGDIIVSGGKLDLGTNGVSTLCLNGNLTVTGTGIITNSGASSKIIFSKSGSQVVSLTPGAMNTTLINVDINSGSAVEMCSSWEMSPLATINLLGSLNTNNYPLKPRALNVGGVLNLGTGLLEQTGSAPITVGGPSFANAGTINCAGTINMAPSSFGSFLIQPGGIVNLTGNAGINLNNNQAMFFIDNGGTLTCGTGKIGNINGTASMFLLNSGGHLSIGSPEGITLSGATGNIQVGGTRDFHYDANYSYCGTEPQVTGSGLPAEVKDLSIINPAGVLLTNDLQADGSLTIGETGKLIIPAGVDLTVRGTTMLGGNNCLEIQSDASFIDNGVPASGSGSVTVERFVTGDAWHYISTPVQPAQASVFLGDYLKPYVEGTLGFGPNITSSSYALDPAKGFALWPSVDRTLIFSDGKPITGTVETVVTRSYTGQPGEIEYDGWNLVGNPFPCAVDLDSLPQDWENTEETAYFWDQSPSASGNYCVYPALAGFGTHSRFVPAMQGFFVRCSSAASPGVPGSGLVRFTNRSKVHSPEAFLKQEEVPENTLLVKATAKENDFYDNLVIRLDQRTSSGYDPGYDARKLWGLDEAPQLYAISTDSVKMTVASLPFDQPGIVVPVGFKSGNPGSYSLVTGGVSSFGKEIAVMLEDLRLNTTTDLRQSGSYSFSFLENDPPERFRFHFTRQDIGFNESGSKDSIKIYSSGGDIIICNLKPENISGLVTIFDPAGREIRDVSFDREKTVRIHPGLSKGCYLIRVVWNRGTLNKIIYLI